MTGSREGAKARRGAKIDELIAELCPEGVEFKTIGEIAECLSGATPASGVAAYWEEGTIPWMSSGEVNKGMVFDTEKKITQAGFDSCSTKMVPPKYSRHSTSWPRKDQRNRCQNSHIALHEPITLFNYL